MAKASYAAMTGREQKKENDVLCYQIRQSFYPGEDVYKRQGQYPSFDLFVKLITMFDVSVDQFIHADGGARSSSVSYTHLDVYKRQR